MGVYRREEEKMIHEIQTFLIMVIGGISISVLYDIYRWIWLAKFQRSWLKHLGDFVFSFIASILVIVLLFYSNWGELRLYVFIGLGIGIITYYKLIKAACGHFL